MNEFLCHYGIKGMKWGIRRYQNPDGSLTAEGIQRYGSESGLSRHIQSENKKAAKFEREWLVSEEASKRSTKRLEKTKEKLKRLQERNKDKPISKKEEMLMNKVVEEGLSEALLKSQAKADKKRAEEHYKSLVDEFGEMAVSKLSDNSMREGDALVASALAGGLGSALVATLITQIGTGPHNYYIGVRSDARRREKSYNKSTKGTSNIQFR